MALQIMTNINVDFYDKKYILINAKQYDSGSRLISITCYNQGAPFNLNAGKHSAYIRYKKPDGYSVLNSCKISYKGEVLVELTEQMLAADGIGYADLIIVNKGSAMVNIETGEIIAIDDAPILSTMAFCISVYETYSDNYECESSYEFNALNDLLKRAESEYTEVSMLAKSYAKGSTGMRDDEDTDNAKYYYNQAKNIVNSIEGIIHPKGTISFNELVSADKFTGVLYVIDDNFITDDTFVDGAGVEYSAGTMVYYTTDGKWDCFESSIFTANVATVDEVKSYLSI